MSEVRWMVPPGSHIAHAFQVAELNLNPNEVTAVRFCGTWLTADLIEAELAERCRTCQRAITRGPLAAE